MVTFSGDSAEVVAAAMAEHLHTIVPPGMLDATPAFDQLLIEFATRDHYETHIAGVFSAMVSVENATDRTPAMHRIPVCYDGEDLAAVASHARMSEDEVISMHQAATYYVALLGFSPGFPYLEGLPSALHTPRRSEPRARIPAGSVAIGGSHTGIYSLPTPGGWNLIGSTTVRLFDLSRCTDGSPETHAFLLKTGDQVKFFAV